MNPLIAELKLDHEAIFRLLDEVESLGVTSDDGKKMMLAAKELFISHLEEEDNTVHAALAAAEENNPELKQIMHLMHFNLKDITKFVIDFFDKYGDGSNHEEFADDFELLMILLKNRMRREERVLFREYEKVAHGS